MIEKLSYFKTILFASYNFSFPIIPSFSVVLPLILICLTEILHNFAIFFFKWFCKLFILGFCAIILISILFKKIFSLSSLFKISSNKTVDLIFLYFLSLFGKKDPIFLKLKNRSIACKTGFIECLYQL